MKNLLLASTSTIHGYKYLEYLIPSLEKFFKGVTEVLFIPYAQPSGLSYEDYTVIAQKGFKSLDITIKGIHEFENPQEAVQNAKGIFVGGGNTFLLTKTISDLGLWSVLVEQVEAGIPYLGSSAGINIAGLTMQSTNDMPIVLLDSYDTLKAVPFNINAHYFEKPKDSKHMGETRDTRIKEFLFQNPEVPVLGLKEGSWLRVKGEDIFLRGGLEAIMFTSGERKVIQNGKNLKYFI